MGRDSSVGIATRCGLDSPGIESKCGRDFPHPSDRPWGPPCLLYNGNRVFAGSKTVVAWRWPATPSSTQVKERVQLYLYSTCGSSWLVIGWSLPFLLYTNRSNWYVYIWLRSERHVIRMTKFCVVAPNIWGSSVWKLLHVTLLAPFIV
jgi:hypothetical protein